MRECPTCFRCFEDDVINCPIEGRPTFNSLPGEVALDGRYVLERRLGEGGMGVVYKAHHKFLKTTRAIKVIKPELVGNDPSFATRFQQEAMAAAAIGHPNIISVPDYGFLAGEIPFLVMEFVEGDSLQEVMSNEGRFSPEKALEYMQVIASGVGAAHTNGIVHRDLKPLNIMIQKNGTPREGIRILDFGLAKIKSGDLFGSFVGAKTTGIIGSPYYMAPEQWSDEEPDKRCDIYSLGIILHQMLTGDVPFKGSSIPAVMKKHLMSPPPQLADLGAGISEELERVVHHALEKDPEARTASAEDLIAELEEAVLQLNAAGSKATKRRTAGKAKATTSRAKVSPAARITAEQKKAQREERELSRQTADQEKALRTSQKDEAPLMDGETLVGVNRQSAQRMAEETDKANDEKADLIQAGGAAPVSILVESARQVVAVEQAAPEKVAGREQEEERELKAHEADGLRRAAEEARRRAEERALRESVDMGEMLPVRVPSLAPQAQASAQLKVPPSRKPQISVGQLLRKPLVLVVLGALIISVLGYALLQFRPASADETTPPHPPESTKPVNHRDMILISGGTFTMGSNVGPVEQRPPHTVTVGSFYMDKTEVTNAEYAEFVKTGHAAPANDDSDPMTKGYWNPWNGNDPPAGRERWPVSNVTANDAEEFAQWLSKRDGVTYRLPTEQEWEYSARNGAADTIFPWGNSWAEGRANMNGASSPKPVASYTLGATQTGLLDMLGNVWEWTSSKGYFYDPKDEKPEERSANRSANIFRGGSFADRLTDSNSSASTDRVWNNKKEQYKHPAIGFRLARDAN
jgi:serine/threonine-protein kinase